MKKTFFSILFLLFFEAQAASLGSVKVLSFLGERLNAEVEILSSGEEPPATYSVRVPDLSAFASMGLVYDPVLLDMYFLIERREKRTFVIVKSKRPVNSPMLTALFELTWPSGKLTRKYSIFLDPPDSSAANREPLDVVVSSLESFSADRSNPDDALVVPPFSAPSSVYRVKPGESLYSISKKFREKGLSTAQLVMSIYKSNPRAFIGKNIDLLRVGVDLKIPDFDRVREISRSEASAFLTKSSAAARGDKRKSGGKLSKPKTTPVAPEPLNELKLSAADGSRAAKEAALKDELVARGEALEDAKLRITKLEENISELKNLVKQKSELSAAVQGLPGVNQVIDSRRVLQTSEFKGQSPGGVSLVQAQSSDVIQPAESQEFMSKDSERAVSAVSVDDSVDRAQNDDVFSAVDVSVSRSLADQRSGSVANFLAFLGNFSLFWFFPPLLLFLLVFFLYRFFSLKKKVKFEDSLMENTALNPSSLFESIASHKTGASTTAIKFSPEVSHLDQEIDPMAEAEIYMAYGRDVPAEEILKEAIQKDPDRLEYRVKLLEIYSSRKDRSSFEVLAAELKKLTGSQGEVWERAINLANEMDLPVVKTDVLPEDSTTVPDSVKLNLATKIEEKSPSLESGSEVGSTTSKGSLEEHSIIESKGFDFSKVSLDIGDSWKKEGTDQAVGEMFGLVEHHLKLGNADRAKVLLEKILENGSEIDVSRARKILDEMG